MRLYSIKDIVADEFGPIFFSKNDGVALRSYQQTISKSPYGSDEMKLFHLGELDDIAGIIACSPREINPESVLKSLKLENPDSINFPKPEVVGDVK